MENAKTIAAAAAAWLAKRDSGVWHEKGQIELDAWMKSNVAHRLAFIRVETAWQQAQRLKALRANTRAGEVPSVGEWQFSPFFDPKQPPGVESVPVRARATVALALWARGVAAGLALAVSVAAAWYGISNRTPGYRTAVGGVETVPLQDGSTVTLNTNSEIRVALTPTERIIRLEGEAFFEVAKDAHRPFVVEVGKERVIAMGTKFSVRRDGDKVRVAVTEGHVRVEAKEAPGQPPAHLEPGDVASADPDGVLLQRKPVAQVEADYLGWRKGYISFRNAPLGEIVAEFNRYNLRKIRVSNPETAAIRIGGEFRVTNTHAFLRLIQQGVPVHAVTPDDEIILLDN